MGKTAQRIATAIIHDILRTGWRVGERLGDESSLRRRFGVGRNVLREALRIVEREGVITGKRGHGGGLFISRPAENAVVNALTNYLELVGIGVDEINETWRIIQEYAIRLASDTDDGEARQRLAIMAEHLNTVRPTTSEAMIELLGEALACVNAASGNRAALLFTQTLYFLSLDYREIPQVTTPRARKLMAKNLANVSAMLKATANGDCAKALWMFQQVAANTSAISQLPWASDRTECTGGRPLSSSIRYPRTRLGGNGSDRGTLAEDLMFNIHSVIVRDRWPVGRNLGTEPELMARHGVSRSILREAIRQLELYGVAEMRRGHGGGLIVTTPRPGVTVGMAALYLQYMQIDLSQLLDIREVLEVAVVESAANHLDATGRRELQIAVAEPPPRSRRKLVARVQSLPRLIASHCGNRILALFFDILVEHAMLTYRYEASASLDGEQWATLKLLLARQLEFVSCIAAGDAPAAAAIAASYRRDLRTLLLPKAERG